MNIIHAFGLAMAIAICPSLHAQGCSGGIGGGMDATGNQCNGPVNETAPPTESRAVRPVGVHGTDSPGRARPLAARPSKNALSQYRTTAMAIPASRSAAPAAAGSPSPRVAKTADTVEMEMTCSGGGDGGMDASGNQCTSPAVGAGRAVATSAKAR